MARGWQLLQTDWAQVGGWKGGVAMGWKGG